MSSVYSGRGVERETVSSGTRKQEKLVATDATYDVMFYCSRVQALSAKASIHSDHLCRSLFISELSFKIWSRIQDSQIRWSRYVTTFP